MRKNDPLRDIFNNFNITNDEYKLLEDKFIKLVQYQSWQLLKKNSRNSHTDDWDDVYQKISFALVKAATYQKRQVYIESCLEVARKYAKDSFLKFVLKELADLWDNRKKHGANRQKFGTFQENLLYNIVYKLVPPHERPDINRPLILNNEFATYCKSVTWNELKSIGRKITREKDIRSGQVSINDFDYLASD